MSEVRTGIPLGLEPWWVRAAWLLPLAVLAGALAIPGVSMQWGVPWVPLLGVDLAFGWDGLSRLFLILVAGVGVAVFFYAPGYLRGDAGIGRLVLLLAAFFVAMVGTVLADDLITFFLFWEATSILSYLLVGFDQDKRTSRDSALHALLITGGGGLLLLAGIVLILQAAPGLRISQLATLDAALLADTRFQIGALLAMAGAMTKSAQFPFHFWLPDAMAAPAPVSAYLHSATMVNLGVYLLARFDEALGSVPWWTSTLMMVGTTTALWGALQCLRERDMKRILAWSTVSALGTLTLLVGLPNEMGALAFVTFVFAHALYKAPLFFVAGIVDHATGTRVIDDLRGLRRYLPLTAAAALLAAVSMAGLPQTVGFIAKDTIKMAKELSDVAWLVGVSGILVSAVALAAASVVAGRVFFGRADPGLHSSVPAESLRLLAPPLALGTIGIAVGSFPGLIESLLIDAARVIAPSLDRGDANLGSDWALRVGTWWLVLALGIVIYARWDSLHAFIERLRILDRIGPASAYQSALIALKRLASFVSRALQSGRLSRYLMITCGGAVIAMLPWILALRPDWPVQGEVRLGLIVGCIACLLGAILAVRPGDTLQRLLGAGVVGFGSAVVFLFGGAPDLALTQFLMETVFVVVAAVALLRYRLPRPACRPGAVHAGIAVAFGLLVAGLMFAIVQQPVDDRMARYFLETSVPEAYGRNVVNVIIVDFRALDTLGEIAVVMLAGLAAWPLLRSLGRLGSFGPPTRSIVLEQTVAPLYWVMLGASAWLLLRGHNAPGGGFVAALVAVMATSAYALIFGVDAARSRLPLPPMPLSGFGLALAAASGLAAAAFGEAFLTHYWTDVSIGGSSLKLSTVLLFDLGVMLCVWGALGGFCLRMLEGRR